MRLAISNALAKFQRAIISSLIGYDSSRFSLLNNLVGGKIKSAIRYRFTLQKNEVFRFPSECREMQVLSGVAWLTVAGKDMILTSKETASLASNKNAIISPLGNVPLVLEVL